MFLKGTLNNFSYLQEWGKPGAKGNQKVWVGPFGHGRLRGDLSYPEDARPGVDEELRWFDYWLKGIDNGIMDEPPVRWYQRAAAYKGEPSDKSGWRTAETWPPNGAVTRRLYLSEDKTLRFEAPTRAESATQYRFDPTQPVPTVGGLNLTLPLGPMDQRAIADRSDYLRFETEVLDEDLVLAGELSMELWASTDGPDTDFMVKVVDVYPNGYEALVLDGGVRARYRKGRRSEDVRPMEPGEPSEMVVDLWHTGITIEKGHKLAVHITSSNDPRFDVNRNNGEEPGSNTKKARIAKNRIFHDREHPSALLLPVMED